jgi:hypothetical protein
VPEEGVRIHGDREGRRISIPPGRKEKKYPQTSGLSSGE